MKNRTSLTALIINGAIIGASIGALLLLLVLVCWQDNISSPTLLLMVSAPLLGSILTAVWTYNSGIAALSKTVSQTNALLGAGSAVAWDRSKGAQNLDATVEILTGSLSDFKQRERLLMENAADVICLLGMDSQILQINKAVQTNWGYSVEEITGKNLGDFLSQDYVSKTLQQVLRADRSIAQIQFENRLRKKSGAYANLLWSAHWSASYGGLFCVAHDITERKQVEQLLKDSEARIRGILEHLPSGVILIDTNGVCLFMNQTGCSLTGYSADAIKDTSINEILDVFKAGTISERLSELLQEQTVESFLVSSSGERIAIELGVSKIELGNEPCFLLAFFDNSQKHAAENAKREFVTMVSHDLRTPLTSINMTLTLLEMGSGGTLNETGAKLTTRARNENERLIGLINDLLDLEKMKAGKFTMYFNDSSLKSVIEDGVNAIRTHADAHKVQVQMEALPEDLNAYCDGARIIQVLINLMDNAIKFSPPGGKVEISAAEKEDKVQITISNKGRPIPTAKLGTIFERFEQVDEADAKVRKGSGLGLTICKTIVRQHSGEIWAVSDDYGTSFHFTLPKVNPEKS